MSEFESMQRPPQAGVVSAARGVVSALAALEGDGTSLCLSQVVQGHLQFYDPEKVL